MPNTGKPSPNCALCRERRIKCDLTRPECLRCKTYGSACPGYRNDVDLMFHQQNPAKIVPKRHRRRSSASRPDTTQPSDICHRPSVQFLLDKLKAKSSDDVSETFLSFLPPLYINIPPNHCLILATDSLIHQYFALDIDISGPKSSRELYCGALGATKNMVASSSVASTDVAIATVWILALYEMLSNDIHYPESSDPSANHYHTQGLISLIQLRGLEQFKTKLGRTIFWASFDHVVLQLIQAKQACPSICWQWLLEIEPYLDSQEYLIHQIYCFLYKATIVVSTARQMMNENKGSLAIFELLKHLETIETGKLERIQLHRQRPLHNRFYCVLALIYYEVEQLLDSTIFVLADDEWLDTRTKMKHLKTIYSTMAHDMIDKIVTNLSNVEQEVIDNIEFRFLTWEETLQNLWVVCRIARHTQVKEQHCEWSNKILVDRIYHLQIKRH